MKLDEKKLLYLYDSNWKMQKIANELGVSVPTIDRRLRTLSGKRRSKDWHRKYTVNHSYFDVIDCEEKAYWLGFLLADGCVRTNSTMLSVNLSSIDIEHLNKLSKCLESNYPIYHQVNEGTYGMSCLTITSKQMTDSLREKGIIANAKKVFDVEPHLLKHFWRGCVDGDGCIGLDYNKYGCPQITVGLIGMPETIMKYRYFCIKLTNTNAKTNIKGPVNYFNIHGNKALAVCDALYQNANIFLDRKMKKYQEYRNIKLQHSSTNYSYARLQRILRKWIAQ